MFVGILRQRTIQAVGINVHPVAARKTHITGAGRVLVVQALVDRDLPVFEDIENTGAAAAGAGTGDRGGCDEQGTRGQGAQEFSGAHGVCSFGSE